MNLPKIFKTSCNWSLVEFVHYMFPLRPYVFENYCFMYCHFAHAFYASSTLNSSGITRGVEGAGCARYSLSWKELHFAICSNETYYTHICRSFLITAQVQFENLWRGSAISRLFVLLRTESLSNVFHLSAMYTMGNVGATCFVTRCKMKLQTYLYWNCFTCTSFHYWTVIQRYNLRNYTDFELEWGSEIPQPVKQSISWRQRTLKSILMKT